MAFKSVDGVVTRKILLTLDEETLEIFRLVGDGNASLGARRIAKQHDGAATVSTTPTVKTKLKSVTKRIPPHVATMNKLNLTHDGQHWFQDGDRLNFTSIMKLRTEYPELRDAEVA